MVLATQPVTVSFVGSREPDQTTRPPESCCAVSPTGAHHWSIEPNTSKTSQGTCLHCGETRTFNNWFDVMYHERESGNGNNVMENY